MSLAPSSPRLPSPPPPAEIQIGPKSPSLSTPASRQASQLEQERIEANAKRRIHPGTPSVDMAAGPPLVPLNELDSPFQLQEHLAALHHYHSASHTQPITRTTAAQLATPPPGIDRTLWLYELCRFLISQCNSLIVGFLFDTPPCSATTCPEMRASEWQFLCAVHEQPKSCCAIDYCCHTLDWAANVVTDPKIFPSRIVLSEAHNKQLAVKNLVNVFRRLHRIFAHAWFQHRGVFWSVEGQTGLYVFFKTVCDFYDLLPAENYKLPPEAEGLETPTALPPDDNMPNDRRFPSGGVPTAIMKPPPRSGGDAPAGNVPSSVVPSGGAAGVSLTVGGTGEDENFQPVGRTNTRRHIRSSPSTGSAVTTVLEADEEDGGDVANRMSDLHISAPETVEEEQEPGAGTETEGEMADLPVIVEHDVADTDNKPDKSDEAASEPANEELELVEFAENKESTLKELGETKLPELKAETKEPEESEKSSDSAGAQSEEKTMEVAIDDEPTLAADDSSTSDGLSHTSIHDWAEVASTKSESPKGEPTMTPQESEDEIEKEPLENEPEPKTEMEIKEKKKVTAKPEPVKEKETEIADDEEKEEKAEK